ncbi:MAG: LolA-like outer membrane lipoprotein chaperone, partial [Nautiliaceae bacterium]
AFKSDFNQTIISDNQKLIYKGKVFYKNKQILWKYIYPEKKYIWVKDKVYIYEPDLMQVTITKKQNLNLQNILKHAKKIKNNLYETNLDNKKIYFIYDKTLKKLYYTDEMGNKVKINFYNQSNEVNDSIFKPKIPDDTDVIYQN